MQNAPPAAVIPRGRTPHGGAGRCELLVTGSRARSRERGGTDVRRHSGGAGEEDDVAAAAVVVEGVAASGSTLMRLSLAGTVALRSPTGTSLRPPAGTDSVNGNMV
jgi:hypothetical protein